MISGIYRYHDATQQIALVLFADRQWAILMRAFWGDYWTVVKTGVIGG